ncbi:MAG: serine/threonine-protein kinase, partial [Planctomycetota bacterium]
MSDVSKHNPRETPADDLVERILAEYLERLNCGESVNIEEYCAQHPEVSEELRGVVKTMDLAEFSGEHGALSIAEAPTLLPDTIGNYRVLREIGRGGMGIVYEAEHETLGRLVALKVLYGRHSDDKIAVERFRREARAIAKLHHTNIVPLFEVGEDSPTDGKAGKLFLAMQLIRGQSLEQAISNLRELRGESKTTMGEILSSNNSAPGIFADQTKGDDSTRNRTASDSEKRYYIRIAEIGAQAAEALYHAHSRGIIHRDIKPSNLLLDEDGGVWLSDFGLAKTDDDAVTKTGDIVGTIRYMAPERFKGLCDERSDIYALGLTLYELLTLTRAFESENQIEIVNLIANQDPQMPRRIAAEIPA